MYSECSLACVCRAFRAQYDEVSGIAFVVDSPSWCCNTLSTYLYVVFLRRMYVCMYVCRDVFTRHSLHLVRVMEEGAPTLCMLYQVCRSVCIRK